MYIAIDFDGTCVTHEYPIVGRDIGAQFVLKRLVQAGHMLVLNTMRDKHYLDDAVNWFNKNNIPLFGINNNPTQRHWTESPKVYANLYIDDAALGMPLKTVLETDRPYVDWDLTEKMLEARGIL